MQILSPHSLPISSRVTTKSPCHLLLPFLLFSSRPNQVAALGIGNNVDCSSRIINNSRAALCVSSFFPIQPESSQLHFPSLPSVFLPGEENKQQQLMQREPETSGWLCKCAVISRDMAIEEKPDHNTFPSLSPFSSALGQPMQTLYLFLCSCLLLSAAGCNSRGRSCCSCSCKQPRIQAAVATNGANSSSPSPLLVTSILGYIQTRLPPYD